MRTVAEVIRRLLPSGTSLEAGERNWDSVPFWPPDLFAVAATLVNLSGCYARPRYLCGLGDECAFDVAYRKSVEDLGEKYGERMIPPDLQALWDVLREEPWRIHGGENRRRWWDAAMQLLAIADHACVGAGFAAEQGRDSSTALRIFEALKAEAKSGKSDLPYLPNSLCFSVPPETACVQPKTRTPQIGCTLRSLSHNLALLPAIGDVKTYWRYGTNAVDDSDEPLNMLLIPFPYEIRGDSFVALPSDEEGDSPRAGFFDVHQKWLDGVTPRAFANFVRKLIKAGRREVQDIHAVVLPEAALEQQFANDVANLLRREDKLEIFISGVVDLKRSVSRNRTFSMLFEKGEPLAQWRQSKHHRWKLDEHQVHRYNLGHVLGKRRSWWENIDVGGRECYFYVFRNGASMAVLICEDLARIDPVQNVVRAVGPNLVVALLMDGPQLEQRWPARYATVLADDPGSAVLTLTSLGLIRRSNMPSEKGKRTIALWKETLGSSREIELPDGCLSLVMTLSPSKEENVTNDGRSDAKTTTKLSLTSVIGLKLSDPPAWLHAV
jgi:hypothetical protein